MGKAAYEKIEAELAHLENQASPAAPKDDSTPTTAAPRLFQERDEFEALRDAMPDLRKLHRYERRAWSSRKKAVLRFIEIQSLDQGSDASGINKSRGGRSEALA